MVRICTKEETVCQKFYQVTVGQSLLPVDFSIWGQNRTKYKEDCTVMEVCGCGYFVFNEECLEDSLLGCIYMKLYSNSEVQDVNDKRSSAENCILRKVQRLDAIVLRLLQFTIRPFIAASNMQHAVVKNHFDVSLFTPSISWKCAKIFSLWFSYTLQGLALIGCAAVFVSVT
jgi:hypothetical protein